jgi:hypothetical protein
MTDVQFLHHNEQVEAARQEFQPLFEDLKLAMGWRWACLTNSQKAIVRREVWRGFLEKRGLWRGRSI